MSTNAKRSDLPNRWNARECGGRGLYNARRAPVPSAGERVANDAVVVFGCIWLGPAKYNQIQWASGGGIFPRYAWILTLHGGLGSRKATMASQQPRSATIHRPIIAPASLTRAMPLEMPWSASLPCPCRPAISRVAFLTTCIPCKSFRLGFHRRRSRCHQNIFCNDAILALTAGNHLSDAGKPPAHLPPRTDNASRVISS